MLNLYAELSARKYLAIPVIKGQQDRQVRNSPAQEATYTIEAMMHDGKALQSGTSHYFGDGFAKAFRACSSPTRTIRCNMYIRPPGACPPA